jgi:hypothetical protein
MIADPDSALGAALVSALTTAPLLAGLIGAAVYDEPPAAPAYPCLQVGRGETRPVGGRAPDGSAGGLEHLVTITALSRFPGSEEVRAVAAAVRAVLHNASLTLDGWRLVSLRVVFVDIYRGSDGRTVMGVIRLRAVTEPLNLN